MESQTETVEPSANLNKGVLSPQQQKTIEALCALARSGEALPPRPYEPAPDDEGYVLYSD